MKLSVSPRMVVLLVFGSLLPLSAENSTSPTSPSSPAQAETPSVRNSARPAAPSTSGKAPVAAAILRAIPVAGPVSESKSAAHRELHREPVSFHPITVKNGPQPYVLDADSLQKGLALISELYRKNGVR